MLLGAVESAGGGVTLTLGLLAREVDVHGTARELTALGGLEGSGSSLGGREVDVTETTAAASVLVGDDTSAGEISELLEGGVQGVVIDSPGKGADEEGRALVRDIGAGLLAGDDGVVKSLALLGRLLSLGLGLGCFL